jgi:activator of 2-hydroxyglutaryl-CoA dehydratase
LGGPLHFLSELKRRFVETLNLLENQVISPENSQLFVAMGAALSCEGKDCMAFKVLKDRLNVLKEASDSEVGILRPLFFDEKEYREFKDRHEKHSIKRRGLEGFDGECFLGIDAGSTTTKAALIDKDGNLLYSYYKSNEGSPLQCAVKILIWQGY